MTEFLLMIRSIAAVSLFTSVIALPLAFAFELEELEQIEQLETLDLFDATKAAAANENISEAERLLDEARNKSGVREGEAEAVGAVKQAEQRIAERRRQEEERLAAEKRAEEERQRFAQQRQQGGSSSTKPGCISVSGDCTSGFGCVIDDFRLTSGPGYISTDSGRSAYRTLCPGYNDALYGTYSYQIRIGDKICSGRFPITPKARSWASVNVFSHNCSISYVNEG